MGLFSILKKPFQAVGKALSKPLNFVKETLDEGMYELMQGHFTPEQILLSALMEGAGAGRCGGFPPQDGCFGGYYPQPCERPVTPCRGPSPTVVIVQQTRVCMGY